MNTLARSRDMKILDGLEKFKYMRSDQIAEIYFTTIKKRDHRIKKTSERMKRLHAMEFVKRMRFPGEPYIYTIGGTAYNNKILHYLAVVDVYIALNKLKPSGSVLYFEPEIKFEDVICDLWVEHKNGFNNKHKEYFVEVELNSSGDISEKVQKYTRLFRHREREGKSGDQLYIIFNKERTGKQITASGNNMALKLIPLGSLETEWTW